MKTLPENSHQQQFSDDLVNDLSFIRKHLRYPFRRMTVMPLLASGLIVGFFLRFIFVVSISKSNSSLMLMMLLLVGLPTGIALKRYVNLIRFFPVTTIYTLQDNIKLLQQFLQENKLLTFRHPKAPEIFMIISKHIDAIGDEREILIFIADEKRILINSHFSSSRKRFRLFIAPTHHGQIIRALKIWLKKRENINMDIISFD